MRTTARFVFLTAWLCTTAAFAGSERWLHVVVDEGGGEKVDLHVPFSSLRSLWPIVDGAEDLAGDALRVGPVDLRGLDLRRTWDELRTAPDGNFLSVDGTEGQVRMGKFKGSFLLHVDEEDEDGDAGASVEIKLPLPVLDALFSGAPGQLDVPAALEALEASAAGEIVRVSDGEDRVRIWIDSRQGP